MAPYTQFRSPHQAIDLIIEKEPGSILLIERADPPRGWALPGGYVDYGESLPQAAYRLAQEETGLEIELLEQFFTYSDPDRDKRCHTITTVFVASIVGESHYDTVRREKARVVRVGQFPLADLPDLVFDHHQIVEDFRLWREAGVRPPLDHCRQEENRIH